jgi:glycosyltransferase involved in cell wall biosynthesis
MTADAVGGVWRYALDLARGLEGAGVRTTLALAGPEPFPAQAAEAADVPRLDLVAPGLPLDWTAAEPQAVEAAGATLADLAQTVGCDLVHLNSPAFAAGARFPVPVLGVAHSCVASWWRTVRGQAPWPEDFGWRTALVSRGYARCGLVAAPTRAFAGTTARLYGLERVETVPNGRRPMAAAPSAEAPDGPFVFTAGRLWDEGKNLAALDAAAARLDLPVYAAGPLEAPHGERRGFGHLRPLGVLGEAEVSAWCAARPVFASTALYEPFGLAVLEAAQAGCPLVLSDIATFRELWDGAAVFVDPHDGQALADVLARLAADPAARRRWGEAARARAGRYSIEAMTAGALALYARLAPDVFSACEAAA